MRTPGDQNLNCRSDVHQFSRCGECVAEKAHPGSTLACFKGSTFWWGIDQKGTKIIDVGQCRAGNHRVRESLEETVPVIVG